MHIHTFRERDPHAIYTLTKKKDPDRCHQSILYRETYTCLQKLNHLDYRNASVQSRIYIDKGKKVPAIMYASVLNTAPKSVEEREVEC